MAVNVQDHIHLGGSVGGAPENAPTLKLSVAERAEKIKVFSSLKYASDGTARFGALQGTDGKPVVLIDYQLRLNVDVSDKNAINALAGQTVYFVDHTHPDDSEDHTDYVKTMALTVESAKEIDPLMNEWYVNIILTALEVLSAPETHLHDDRYAPLFVQADAPAAALASEPSFWYDTDTSKMYLWDGAQWLEAFSESTDTFTLLNDTPASYTGKGLQYVRVASGETALEFANPPGDASEITYTPAATADWPGDVDPGNVNDALDDVMDYVENTIMPDSNHIIALSSNAKTLSSGAFTCEANASHHVITPETGNADELVTISGGTTGQVLTLMAASGKVILVGSGGNINIDAGLTTAFIFDATRGIMLRYNGSTWDVIHGFEKIKIKSDRTYISNTSQTWSDVGQVDIPSYFFSQRGAALEWKSYNHVGDGGASDGTERKVFLRIYLDTTSFYDASHFVAKNNRAIFQVMHGRIHKYTTNGMRVLCNGQQTAFDFGSQTLGYTQGVASTIAETETNDLTFKLSFYPNDATHSYFTHHSTEVWLCAGGAYA